jgi:hypothetical protein
MRKTGPFPEAGGQAGVVDDRSGEPKTVMSAHHAPQTVSAWTSVKPNSSLRKSAKTGEMEK